MFSYGLFVQLRHGYLESICGPRVRPSCSTTGLLLGQSPHIRTVLNRGMKFFNISFLVLFFHMNLTRNWVVALVSHKSLIRYIHYYYYPLQSIHPSPNFLLISSPAHFKSVLTFPNNIYRHTCYCFSSVKQLKQYKQCKQCKQCK